MSDRFRAELPHLLREHPLIAGIADRCAIVLHGSRTIGIDDDCADWDVWLLTDDATAAQFERAAGTRFVDFNPPRGHFQVEPLADLRRRLKACDFPLISELRYAQAIADPASLATDLLALARQPMRDAVRLTWFRYHYVEMRSDHRTCDNPIDRGDDPVALLIGVANALQHALRAAMVLDGEPYRYSKWLTRMAARTPTGAKVVTLVERATRLIGSGALDLPGPEAQHPLTLQLRLIRQTLIDAAVAAGIDEPWLRQWWLHIDKARRGIDDVTW
jgi:hypothetical protein